MENAALAVLFEWPHDCQSDKFTKFKRSKLTHENVLLIPRSSIWSLLGSGLSCCSFQTLSGKNGNERKPWPVVSRKSAGTEQKPAGNERKLADTNQSIELVFVI